MPTWPDLARAAILLSGLVLVGSASAATITFPCGSAGTSTVKTESVESSSQSTTFVAIAGATLDVVIPPGPNRCIKISFSVIATCDTNGTLNGLDGCFVRAMRSGGELNPKSALASFTGAGVPNFGEANSFEWIARVGPGTHTIAMQQRVQDNDTVFAILRWVLDVELTN